MMHVSAVIAANIKDNLQGTSGT